MSWIDYVGIALSALTAIAFIGLLAHSVTTHLPGRSSGGKASRQRPLGRWAWTALLAMSFFVGFYGVPLRRVFQSAESEHGVVTAELRDHSGRPADSRSYVIRAPFYVRQRTDERSAGGAWRTTERQSVLQLPWAFLCVSAAYLVLAGWRGPRAWSGGRRSRRARLSLI